MSVWNWVVSTANAQAGIKQLGQHYDELYDQMTGRMGDTIKKWNIWQEMVDYLVSLTKQLINESRELIAVSTKYDIPIKKMGEFQMMAQLSGQSLGQVARNFRFLEMNMGRALLKPGGPQYQALKELGLSQDEITAAAQDTGYALDVVRQKVMTIGDEERRNAFLQSIFGANWQNMLPIIEMSAQAQQEAADAGYEYSESMTQSLATVEKNMAEIGQDLKPLVMPFAQLFAVIVNLLAMAVQGAMTLAKIFKDKIYATIQGLVGGLQYVVGIISKIQGKALKFIGLESLGNLAEGAGDEMTKSGKKNLSAYGDAFDAGKTLDKYSKDIRNMEALQDRLNVSAYGFAESLGLEETNALAKKLNAEYTRLSTTLSDAGAKMAEYRKRLFELDKKAEEGSGLTPEELAERNALSQSYVALQQRSSELQQEMNQLKKTAGQSSVKLTPVGGVDGKTKPRTAEEIKAELDKRKAEREAQYKNAIAQMPKVAEMETTMAVVNAYHEKLRIEQEIEDLKKNNAYSLQQEVETTKRLAAATNTLMEKEKDHAFFIAKMTREREDAERQRKESVIAGMEKREQTFMARQGMTGIDKQAVAVQNAIEKMVRDQEQLSKVEKDRTRGQADREAAKKVVDESALKAMEELDKLTLMQFQYGASDAAKKGMGGGIDIRENQLTVAKDQLDILRKQYDIMLKQYGLSPDQFGNVPFMMQGSMRAGK